MYLPVRTGQIVAALALSACMLPGGQRVEPLGGDGSGGAGVVIVSPATPKRGQMRKRVTAKQEPDRLIAEDGTACRVSAERFRAVEVGNDELCNWQ
jgi:hypothetical protein